MDPVKLFLSLAPLALLASCGGAADNAASNEAGAADAPAPVAAVRTALASQGATSDTIALYGVAEAGGESQRALTVQAEATLSRILAPNGTAVRAGQVVAVLTPSATTRSDAVKAGSDAAAANAALARAIRLRKDGLVSDADVETARAAAVSANALRASTAQRNGTLVLRAPVSGTVQNLTARPGDLIAAGTAVATIGALGDLRARFGVDPAMAARIHPGQPVEITPINAATKILSSVSGVDPQVDATTRLASVFTRVPGDQGVGAGEPLRATIGVGGTSQGITIPYSALLDDGGRSYVFVVEGGVAKSRDVSPGNSAGDRIQILKGLQPGERVVTEGGTALEDGMKVREDVPGAAVAK
jgi:RND family efflux transporter MFP subunit